MIKEREATLGTTDTAEVRVADHVAYIDGLRAIAVLAVVVDHATLHNPALVGTIWPGIAFLGAHGVELFFVISGLCLAQSFLRRRDRTGSLGFDGAAFFAKRIVRILPPYYVTVALLATLSLTPLWLATTLAPAGGSMVPHLSLPGLFAHFFFAEREQQSLNLSFWSLRVESIWYLLFPLTLFVYVRSRTAFWGIAIVCAVLAYASAFTTSLGLVGTIFAMATALPAFMLGVVVADPRVDRALSTNKLWLLFAVASIAGVVTDHVTGSRIVWGITAFAFVGLARRVPWLRGALSIRALSSIGVASFSIYLVHEPTVAMLEYLHVPQIVAMILCVAAGLGVLVADRTSAHGRSVAETTRRRSVQRASQAPALFERVAPLTQ